MKKGTKEALAVIVIVAIGITIFIATGIVDFK